MKFSCNTRNIQFYHGLWRMVNKSFLSDVYRIVSIPCKIGSLWDFNENWYCFFVFCFCFVPSFSKVFKVINLNFHLHFYQRSFVLNILSKDSDISTFSKDSELLFIFLCVSSFRSIPRNDWRIENIKCIYTKYFRRFLPSISYPGIVIASSNSSRFW